MSDRVVNGPIRIHRLCAVFVAALFAALLVVPSSFDKPVSAATRSPVVVSLTYDDGTADQLRAASLMARHGMTGTFYLNSSRLDAPGRISRADARRLQAAGHEIGGHTLTHANLTTLSASERKRQICNDRTALRNAGLRVTTFAYPFGKQNIDVRRVTASCGYNAARGIGGLVAPASCFSCPYAERIPPAYPYSIRAAESIKPSVSLAAMQGFVRQAEEHNGGWVVIVMHRICDDCDPYATRPAKLEAFLSWLAARKAGGTVVKPVASVIGGAVRPTVSGPTPPPVTGGGQLLRNATMEADANGDGLPNCWQRGGYGNNSYAWSRAANPHGGSVAQQVKITRFVTGDRKIMSPQDLGACAPATVVGHRYRVAGWYRTNGSNRLVAYYRNAADRWVYLGQSAPLPTSATSWRQAVWTTPALPTGSRALSVGFSLRSVGVTAADDVALTDAGRAGG